MKKRKLKGGSLTYAVVFSLIVSVFCMTLVLLFYYSSQSVNEYTDVFRAQINAKSGINLLLSNQQIIDSPEKKTIDLYGNGTDSVELERNYWGAFDLITATSIQQDYRFGLSALTGLKSISDSGMIAIYLSDLNNPLKIAGETIIKGNCYLPAGTIKAGNMNGESFIGDKLVDGVIKKSSSQGMDFNKDFMAYLIKQFTLDTMKLYSDSVINIDQFPLKDSLVNNFTNRPVTIYSKGEIILSNIYLYGKIKILSEIGVIIKSSSQIKDAIVFAPDVEIENGFTGNLQAFATDSISIGEKCNLKYPSVLGVVRTVSSKTNSSIKIQEDSNFAGEIFGIQETTDLAKHVFISLSENTKVIGRVYSCDLLETKGKVYGSIICNKILYTNSSSVYENHLYNAVIDITKLPASFVGTSVLKFNSQKGIVKWL
ncbi:MAG TPA: hypothetical protein VKG26_00545 [Bacteroidia bacterium]|nr:hypothetical protein [Bacteroidia bacterium]